MEILLEKPRIKTMPSRRKGGCEDDVHFVGQGMEIGQKKLIEDPRPEEIRARGNLEAILREPVFWAKHAGVMDEPINVETLFAQPGYEREDACKACEI